MHTFTEQEFKNIVENSANWSESTEIEELDNDFRFEYDHDQTGEQTETKIPHTFGQAVLTHTETDLNISIKFFESYSYDNDQPGTLTHSTEAQDKDWEFEGFEVVDEDGDKLEDHQIADLLPSHFSDIDYSEIEEGLDSVQLVDEGRECPPDLEDICIENDNAPNLAFFGIKIGRASSKDPYRNGNGRWTELDLYKTKSGLYVCHEHYHTCWQGERNKYKAQVCENFDEVKEFFGYGWLAKDLYEDAGIEAANRIA